MNGLSFDWVSGKEKKQIISRNYNVQNLPRIKVFAAKANGETAGYVIFSGNYLARVFVEPDFRKSTVKGKSIAKQMLQRAVVEQLGANRFRSVYLTACTDEPKKQKAFEKILKQAGFNNTQGYHFEVPKSMPLSQKPKPKPKPSPRRR